MGYPDIEAHDSGNVTTFPRSRVQQLVTDLGFDLNSVESVHLFYDEARVYTYDLNSAGRIIIERDPSRTGHDRPKLKYTTVRYVTDSILKATEESGEEPPQAIDSPTPVL